MVKAVNYTSELKERMRKSNPKTWCATERRRKVQLPRTAERCQKRIKKHHPTKSKIPVYVYYNDEACVELHVNWDLSLGETMEMAEHPGCVPRQQAVVRLCLASCRYMITMLDRCPIHSPRTPPQPTWQSPGAHLPLSKQFGNVQVYVQCTCLQPSVYFP